MTNKASSRNGPGSLFRKKRHRQPPPGLDIPLSGSFISPPTPADPELGFDKATRESTSRPSTAFLTEEPESIASPDDTTTTTTSSSASVTNRSGNRRNSSLGSLSEFKGHFRRHSASLRSKTEQSAQVDNLAFRNPSDVQSASTTSLQRPTINTQALSNQPSAESVHQLEGRAPQAPASAVEQRSRGLPLGSGNKREEGFRPLPPAPPSLSGLPNGANATTRSISLGNPAPASGPNSNPRIVFQHVQDVASKRISTLDYLRKAHEGRVFWFNALRFTKADLQKIPYFEPRRLGRRAINYLLLGVSIPAILDPHKDVASEYLRQFHILLTEFESYQNVHTPDGIVASSLSRARIPQMFRRATQSSSSSKGRRAASSAEAVSPPNTTDSGESRSAGGLHSASSTSSYTSFPASEQELLPGEGYSLLLTPSLPFDPDYFETFATLCDVLIDCYTRVMGLVNGPDAANSNIGDLFSKVDSKIRKILISGLVRDFEEASKQGIKSELAGVGKIALSGLI